MFVFGESEKENYQALSKTWGGKFSDPHASSYTNLVEDLKRYGGRVKVGLFEQYDDQIEEFIHGSICELSNRTEMKEFHTNRLRTLVAIRDQQRELALNGEPALAPVYWSQQPGHYTIAGLNWMLKTNLRNNLNFEVHYEMGQKTVCRP